MQTVAVVGSGISGLATALLLQQKYKVTVFEQDSRLGGHSNTVVVNTENKSIPVDTGFIVYNYKTYPNFIKLLDYLKIAVEPSNMSFGVSYGNGLLEYSGSSLNGIFAQRKNIFNYKYLLMLKHIVKFNKAAVDAIENNKLDLNLTLEDFVNRQQLGSYFKKLYLYPMAAAIWSCPLATMLQYPAQTFLRFFYNHGLLATKNHPQWFTLTNKSIDYVTAIAAKLDNVNLNSAVQTCTSSDYKLNLQLANGNSFSFDKVVFACHSDQSQKILANNFVEASQLLSKINYRSNLAVLHKDASLMPNNPRAWSSWNYLYNAVSNDNNDICLTYWMNRLQNIDNSTPLFVTLNPKQMPKPELTYKTINYRHPVFNAAAVLAQQQLKQLQGDNNIWFAGAWLGYGFHEDGLKSAIQVAEDLGCRFFN